MDAITKQENRINEICETAQIIRKLELKYEIDYSLNNVKAINEINGRKRHLNQLWREYRKNLESTHIVNFRTKRILI